MATYGFISHPSSPIPEELAMADLDSPTANQITASSTLPRSAKRCRIPRLNRSTSVRVKPEGLKSDSRPKSLTLSMSRDYPWQLEGMRYGDLGSVNSVPFSMDDDSSVKSFGSYASYASFASQSQCTEASLSRPMSRSYYSGKKYVLHCERHLAKPEEYLTPTQRKDKEIRQLKSALMKITKANEEKEAELEGMRTEMRQLRETLEELQVGKHSLMNTSQESDSLNGAKNSSVISFESGNDSDRSDIQTVTRNNDSGISVSLSPRNSSEFDDIVDNKVILVDKSVCTDPSVFETKVEVLAEDLAPKLLSSYDFDKFLGTYKLELDELKSQHKEHYQDLKERFNDRVDDLLQKLTDANSRYLELRPILDRAQGKIHSIESQLTEVQKDMETQEEYHSQMYLKMYRKGQEAARFTNTEDSDYATIQPELLRNQLQQLEQELEQTRQLLRSGDHRQAEYTLRFLKDAVFYFLTKKDKEHLKAIQSILGFTDAERMAVAKAMKHRRL